MYIYIYIYVYTYMHTYIYCSIRVVRANPLAEIGRTVSCRAIRGRSSDSRQQYLSRQYPSPLLKYAAGSIGVVFRG